MARVPAGLLSGTEGRLSGHSRGVRRLINELSRISLTNRRSIEAALRAGLRQIGLTAYRGWRRLLANKLRVTVERPEPGFGDLDAALDQKNVGATLRQGPLTRARLGSIVRTEANRLNQWARERAIRDVVASDQRPRKIVAWRYTTMMDDRVRPSHRIRDGRRFRVGTRRIPLPDGVGCRCIYLPVYARA